MESSEDFAQTWRAAEAKIKVLYLRIAELEKRTAAIPGLEERIAKMESRQNPRTIASEACFSVLFRSTSELREKNAGLEERIERLEKKIG